MGRGGRNSPRTQPFKHRDNMGALKSDYVAYLDAKIAARTRFRTVKESNPTPERLAEAQRTLDEELMTAQKNWEAAHRSAGARRD